MALLLPFSFGVPLLLGRPFSFLPGHYTPLFYSFEPIDTIVYLEYRPRLPLKIWVFPVIFGVYFSPFFFVASSFWNFCVSVLLDRGYPSALTHSLTLSRKDLSLTPSGVSGHFPSRYSSTHFLLYSYVYRIIIPPTGCPVKGYISSRHSAFHSSLCRYTISTSLAPHS